MFSAPKYHIIAERPRYCRITDGIIGKIRTVIHSVYTLQMANHIVALKNKEQAEENSLGEEFYYVRFEGKEVIQESLIPPGPHRIVEDDIPF